MSDKVVITPNGQNFDYEVPQYGELIELPPLVGTAIVKNDGNDLSGIHVQQARQRSPIPHEPGLVFRIRPSRPEIKGGALAKETIRRVVQRRLNEIRYCYEEGMHTQPDLGDGRVTVQFVVTASGEVRDVAATRSTLGDRVDSCIVSVVKRWTFPALDGSGVVKVSYPLMLQHTRG